MRDRLKQYTTAMYCDFILTVEQNKNMSKMKTWQQLVRHRMKHWWENTITLFEWLPSQSTSQNEVGGMAIITNTRSSAHIGAVGVDNHKVER